VSGKPGACQIDQLFDKLIQGKSPEENLGKNGLIKQLTKRAAGRASAVGGARELVRND
jgi:hypothetical protein